jgi:hypothetical protein
VFKFLLISIVLVPVLFGVRAARARRGLRGLPVLLGSLLVYDVLWLFMLYYLHTRWIG